MEYLEKYTIQRLTSSDFHLDFHESLDLKMYLGFVFSFPLRAANCVFLETLHQTLCSLFHTDLHFIFNRR